MIQEVQQSGMRAIPETLYRTITRIFLLGMIVAGVGCEKPKLRSDAAEETVESTPATKPINPFSPRDPASGGPVGESAPVANPSAPPPRPESAPAPRPALDPVARAREYTRLQKMLEAQLIGIRNLESDLARHSASLTQLRNQLQLTKSRQAGAGSGGIRIERIGGESTLIDRKAEARELETKIKAEEPFVAQLTTALQGARRQYEDLRRTAEDLLRE